MTTWQLQEYPTGKAYSVLERQLFAMIPKNGNRISNQTLLQKRLEAGPWSAQYPRSIISVTMNKLVDKVRLNKEPFVVNRTIGHRHEQVYYWLEKAGKSKAEQTLAKRKVKRKPSTSRRTPPGNIRPSLLD